MASRATPLVYVYNTSLRDSCVNIRKGKDTFEHKVPALFLAGLMRTSTPSEADLFYHPACLTDLFWQARLQGGGESRSRRVEALVLAEIDALGHSTRPHIINAMRCHESCRSGSYTKDARGRCLSHEHNPDSKAAWQFGSQHYPVLWGTDRFLRFCMEAPRAVDMGTSAYIPYCPSGPTPPAPFTPNRRMRALFIGSPLIGRALLLAAAARTPGVHVVNLTSRAHTQSAMSTKELMRDAVFTICPSGDTPESQRIYQAVQRGSVPLVTNRFQFPFGNVDWHSLSAPLCITSDGTLGLPHERDWPLLQRSVHAHMNAFDCELSNPFFLDFLARALRVFAGWAPVASRTTVTRLWEEPRPPPRALSVRLLPSFIDKGAQVFGTNENWRACPARMVSSANEPHPTINDSSLGVIADASASATELFSRVASSHTSAHHRAGRALRLQLSGSKWAKEKVPESWMPGRADPEKLMDLVVHSGTNLTWLLARKNWSEPQYLRTCPLCRQILKNGTGLQSIKRLLPSSHTVRQQLHKLARSSCAVVGASAALANCSASREICGHDVVFHVNDHPAVRQMIECERVDAHVANQHVCLRSSAGRELITHSRDGKVRQCATTPSAFRFRHEWHMRQFISQAPHAWLSTGILTTLVHDEIRRRGKCCATAGGVAAGFALRTCRRVTLFGLGGVGKGHVETPQAHIGNTPAHNVKGELDWLQHLNETGTARLKCV